MKCAAAKTWLSFVTVTLNSLCAAMSPPSPVRPTTLQQNDVDRRAGEVGGGARVQRVGLVPQRAVERGHRLPPGRGADATGLDRGARTSLHRGRRDRKSTRLNSSHVAISYAVFCSKKKTQPALEPRAMLASPHSIGES